MIPELLTLITPNFYNFDQTSPFFQKVKIVNQYQKQLKIILNQTTDQPEFQQNLQITSESDVLSLIT